MKRIKKLLWIPVVILAYVMVCQFAPVIGVAQISGPTLWLIGLPPGGAGAACTAGSLGYFNLTTGALYTCRAGTWQAIGGGSLSTATISYPPHDFVCAQAADTTIAVGTITGGASTASASTITIGATALLYHIGSVVDVVSALPAGYNVNGALVSATTSTTVTYANTANPGAWSSAGTVGLHCGNQSSDAISTGSILNGTFATSYTVPANFWQAGRSLRITASYTQYTSATTAESVTAPRLYQAGTTFYSAVAAYAPSAAISNNGWSESWTMGSATDGTAVVTGILYLNEPVISPAIARNGIAQPQSATNGSIVLAISRLWVAQGVASGTYTSGITAVGTIGQTCALTSFNQSSTAVATVALTGSNTIAGGTALVITTRGLGNGTAPTTATAGNGTATCSGTATISTVLGGSPGNALGLQSLIVEQLGS